MKTVYSCSACNYYTAPLNLKYIGTFADTYSIKCNFCNVVIDTTDIIDCTWELKSNSGHYIMESVNTLQDPKYWLFSPGEGNP